MRSRAKRMSFEKYLEVYQFSWRSNILTSDLNQLLEMHGFIKLRHESKARLQECLDWIDLMEPMRSTLEESISSCAFVSAEEIVSDLDEVGWRECLIVRSVQTLKSPSEEQYIAANEDLPFVPRATAAPRRRRVRRQRSRLRIPPADFVIAGKRPRSKRKRVSVNALISSVDATVSSVSSSSGAFNVVDETEGFVPPLPVSPPPATPPPPSSPPPPLTPPPSDPF